jgi:HSP20 family molecular chaperone IbpA
VLKTLAFFIIYHMLEILMLTALLAQTGQRPQNPQDTQDRLQGFQQQGQLTSDAAIVRDSNSFIGGNSQNFMSDSQNSSTNNINQNGNQYRSQNRQGQSKQTVKNPQGSIRYRIRYDSQSLTPKVPVINKIPGLEKTQVTIKVFEKKATIIGVVTDQKQKELITRLVLLQPGISQVINELTVN